MKAAVVEKPGLLRVRHVPDPVPGDYEALCELLYGATCTGTDSHIIRGDFPFPLPYPVILGHESVGRVIRVGRKVRNLRAGDLVTRVGAPPGGGVDVAWGGYAELGLARDHWAMRADGLPAAAWSSSLVNQVVPAGIDERVAPMFTTWRETLSYVRRMGVDAASRVLVIGSGGNALSFATHGVNLGASRVYMVGAQRLESRCRALGISGFVDYRRADAVEALRGECPAGFDVVIDAVGKAGQADLFLPLLVAGGKIGIYGMDDYATVTLSPRRAAGSFVVWNGGYDEAETHQQVSDLVLQGRLDAGPWYDVGHPYPLDAIMDAFQDLWNRTAVKALIRLVGISFSLMLRAFFRRLARNRLFVACPVILLSLVVLAFATARVAALWEKHEASAWPGTSFTFWPERRWQDIERRIGALPAAARLDSAVIGEVHYRQGSFPIHALRFAAAGTRPLRVLLVSGVHGTETAGVDALLQLAEALARAPSRFSTVAIDLIPVVNPWGWTYGYRYDGDGEDVNRDFASRRTQEARIIRRFMLENGPYDLFMDLHESKKDGYFVYQYLPRGEALGDELVRIVRAAGKPLEDRYREGAFAAHDGILAIPAAALVWVAMGGRLSLEQYARLHGVRHAYTVETPLSDEFADRAAIHRRVAEAFITRLAEEKGRR